MQISTLELQGHQQLTQFGVSETSYFLDQHSSYGGAAGGSVAVNGAQTRNIDIHYEGGLGQMGWSCICILCEELFGGYHPLTRTLCYLPGEATLILIAISR